ncbi:hypothetical protein HETIRDRAFT_170564 [Heterobasidion irregulare TC 32-1]|uniref:Uncharacterized protein n=1 Tax=Heterobasidion irregulare (strain TC 32-1) TaxID=747525 RepID=W4KFJ2_HETIT|nr:uncharacterized protein HETIRDRAFT_170564 [Heterobasidion irregulare TC 32-1]ETW84085.1 hypothetical protein HETIRDRAFT_170564 [Heterobasidion irregulare TC 32-1]
MFCSPPTKDEPRTTHATLVRAHQRQQTAGLPSYKQPPPEKSVTSNFDSLRSL